MKKALPYLLVGVCLPAYIILGVLAHTHPYFAWDLEITRALQAHRSSGEDTVMAAISWPGFPPQFMFFFLPLLGVLYFLGLRIAMLILAGAEAGVGLVGFAVKPLVGRLRPPASLVWVRHPLTQDPYTFTAGHVHTELVIFGVIVYLAVTRIPEWTVTRVALVTGSVLWLLLTAFSRIYLGDHWPSDVLGAFLAGGTWLGVAFLLLDHFVSGSSGATPRRRARRPR